MYKNHGFSQFRNTDLRNYTASFRIAYPATKNVKRGFDHTTGFHCRVAVVLVRCAGFPLIQIVKSGAFAFAVNLKMRTLCIPMVAKEALISTHSVNAVPQNIKWPLKAISRRASRASFMCTSCSIINSIRTGRALDYCEIPCNLSNPGSQP